MAGWAYAHPDFGRIVGAARQRWRAALQFAHLDFHTLRHPCLSLIFKQVIKKCLNMTFKVNIDIKNNPDLKFLFFI